MSSTAFLKHCSMHKVDIMSTYIMCTHSPLTHCISDAMEAGTAICNSLLRKRHNAGVKQLQAFAPLLCLAPVSCPMACQTAFHSCWKFILQPLVNLKKQQFMVCRHLTQTLLMVTTVATQAIPSGAGMWTAMCTWATKVMLLMPVSSKSSRAAATKGFSRTSIPPCGATCLLTCAGLTIQATAYLTGY